MNVDSKVDMSYISFNGNHYCVRVKRLKVRVSFHITSSVNYSQALAEALEFRNSLYAQYDLPSRTGEKPIVRVNSRNGNNLLSGVSLSIERSGLSVQAYFITRYKPGNEWLRERFSISRLGYVQAWREAVALRLLHHPIGTLMHEMKMLRPTAKDYELIRDLAPDVPVPA